MNNVPSENNTWHLSARNIILLSVCPFLLGMAIILLTGKFVISDELLFVLCSLPFIPLVLMSFEAALSVFILSFFINFYYTYFAISEIAALLVIASYFTTYRFSLAELKKYIPPAFSIFILSVSFSYINSVNIVHTLFLSLRILVFFILCVIIPSTIASYESIKKYFLLFISVTLVNALQVIFLGVTSGKRVFGFSGVMFVDYAGLSIVLTYISLLYKEKGKTVYFAVLFLLILGLIFTQTRTIWMVTAIALLIITLHYIIKSKKLGYNRAGMMVMLCIAAIIIVIVGCYLVKGQNFKRISQVTLTSRQLQGGDFSELSSLVTRFFIWQTAFHGFLAHPIIGIGFYAFPSSSKLYSTLDPRVYRTFVEGLTPHLTYITMLCETGIIGIIGFLIYLVSTLKSAKRILLNSTTKEGLLYSSLALWSLVYVYLSMGVTDAWLCGHGLMLWGFVLGLSTANRKIFKEKRCPNDVI